eukprot:gnl/TRDRNA2_/TRDRNA2_143008_c0_seq2.p1 gnl/TRDRNA2_/TRDRNA2_143008_c0~~gnl/TRDRNA2_/TRDRNA2_143008_c0_seq2.p1  ORF type:complete len:104 (+),score=18.91 gnl/TRDRNA2_/TRDRNA2_143008_c0_seq2:167-478(+)
MSNPACWPTAVARAAGPWSAKDLAHILWAFASMQHLDDKMFMNLARTAEQRVSEGSPQTLAQMVWVFSTVKQPEAKLFAVLAGAAKRQATGSLMDSQTLSNTA